MIPALGAEVTVTREQVTVNRTLLAASLSGTPAVTVPVAEITGIDSHSPDALLPGRVVIHRDEDSGGPVAVRFAPGQAARAEALLAAVNAALAGEEPAASAAELPVKGLDALAVAVSFGGPDSGPNSGALESVRAVRVTDGVAGEETTPADAAALHELVRQAPVVFAHNAQLVLGELVRAGWLDGPVVFGCTLALARAAGVDAETHDAAGLAAALSVPGSGAGAVGGVAAAVARATGYTGDAVGLFHSLGLTVGTVVGADGKYPAGTVYPVLVDRDGAAVAAQRAELAGSGSGADDRRADADASAGTQSSRPTDEADAGAAAEAVQEALLSTAQLSSTAGGRKKSGGGGKKTGGSGGGDSRSGGSRGRAPWAAVATPDTVPEPNPDADPAGVLYGENVTLTGDFEPFDKGQLWSGIANHGGTVGKNVTKKTTVLVVGEWGSMTSKEKRARQLRDGGQDIQIWPAADLVAALGLDEEPPF